MRLNSLAFRLFATSAAWTLLVLPIAGMVLYYLSRDDALRLFDQELITLVDNINLDSMDSNTTEPVPPKQVYAPLFELTHSGWYWQIKPIDEAGAKKLVSSSLATGEIQSPLEKNIVPDAFGRRFMNGTGPTGEGIRIAEVISTVGREDGKPRYSIIVTKSFDWFEDQMERLRNRLAHALSLAGFGLVAVTLFQVRFGLLPLQKIERGLADVREGKASALEGELPAEIEPLQSELNALIQSNQNIVDRARAQVGNLAHALKTPLAVITNEAGDEKTAFGKKVAEQARLMRDQINHYLDRARMATRVSLIGRVTPVLPVVDPLVRALERIHRDKGVRILATVPPEAKFQGEKQDLEEMLGNLLDNACKWAKRDVTLTVTQTVDAKGRGRRLSIAIDDDGPGLSPGERAKIGKRGVRLDETKPGSGLGLSIVTDLALSYRGSFSLVAAAKGGISARLDLPAV